MSAAQERVATYQRIFSRMQPDDEELGFHRFVRRIGPLAHTAHSSPQEHRSRSTTAAEVLHVQSCGIASEVGGRSCRC